MTLLGLGAAEDISADAAMRAEIARVLAKPVEHFCRRHSDKQAAVLMLTQQEHGA